MKRQILIVDDEPNIRKMVQKYAAMYNMTVDEAASGDAALTCIRDKKYDLVIMDIMMPVMDGYTAVEKIRAFSTVPILMLSAKGEADDRLKGLSLWVDDYMVKPFSLKELMLRIEAILNRSNHSATQDVYRYKGLELNMTRRTVFVDDVEVEFSAKEFNLLAFLISNRGHTATRYGCIRNVWGDDYEGDDRTLDTHIKMIRQHLKQYGTCILTQRGVGYRFEEI